MRELFLLLVQLPVPGKVGTKNKGQMVQSLGLAEISAFQEGQSKDRIKDRAGRSIMCWQRQYDKLFGEMFCQLTDLY